MAGPELTPELLAQLESDVGHFHASYVVDSAEWHPEAIATLFVRMIKAWPVIVAAAKERDQLREAVRLREHATLEAWSGSLSGLDAAGAASARAEALDALAGIDTPTAEQQRDAALSKLGAVLLEKRQLCAEVERLLAAKPDLVHIDRNGESLCHMELHEGPVPLTSERGEVTCIGCWILRDEEAAQAVSEVERLRGLGLEAAEHGARNALQSPTSLVRLYKIRAEIERKP